MATRSLNKVFLLGNLTRDPELRYTAKGTAVCTFVVATNREWSPSDTDEKMEETEYNNVVSWSKLAELCSQLLYKGRKVFIEGRLNTIRWDDSETGKRVSRTEVVCTEMVALGAPRQVDQESGEKKAAGKDAQPTENMIEQLSEIEVSEIEEEEGSKEESGEAQTESTTESDPEVEASGQGTEETATEGEDTLV